MDMLQTDGRLVDLSIARWCAERGDELLAAVIRRIVEAGVDTGRAELPLVLALIDLPADGRSSEHVVIAVHDAVAAVREGGASWLLPWLWNALARLATSEGGIEGILQGVVEPLLRDLVGCNETEVSAARELVALDWPVVWEKLGELADLQGLRAACAVVAQVADWFDRGSGKSRSATDLGELLAAAEQRGHHVAVQEHLMVLATRGVMVSDEVADSHRMDILGTSAAELAVYFQRTGAIWVLIAAVEAAQMAYSLAPEGHVHRANYALNLGSLLSASVTAGVVQATALVKAIGYKREAYTLLPKNHPSRALSASNLGLGLAEAVRAGVLQAGALGEAVDCLREAYTLTPKDHPDRARYASNLGGLLAEAVVAGVLQRGALGEAVGYQREAHVLAPPGHPDHVGYASNLGSSLTQAVQAGLLPAEVLHEAVGYQREAYTLTASGHPDRARCASNLGALLSDAVQAGVLSAEVLGEAVDLQREACTLTPNGHPFRALYTSNLCMRLTEAVLAGVLDAEVLGEAICCAREAYEATPAPSHLRAQHASTLGVSLSVAVRAGVLEPKALVEAVGYEREAYGLTPEGHPDRAGRASNLGSRLAESVQAGLLSPEASREAVGYEREAYRLTPEGHPDRAGRASNLGNRLAEGVRGQILDATVLGEAVACQREAYTLTPEGHPDRARCASSLGGRLTESVQAGVLNAGELVEAVRYQREAYTLTPEGHPDRARHASNLGGSLSLAVREGVIGARAAAREVSGLVDDVWRMARAGVTPNHRRLILTNTQELARTAPLLLLKGLGAVEAVRAVEALRGHLSGGMHAPRLPDGRVNDELAAAYLAAAARYESAQERAVEGITSYAAAAPAVMALADAVEQVRAANPSLVEFGGRPLLANLTSRITSDSAGIYLLPGAETHDGAAVILRSSEPPKHLPLPGFSRGAVGKKVVELLGDTGCTRGVCEWLWDTVTEPLLKELSGTTDWVVVPTGHVGMLPLHAAGSHSPRIAGDSRTSRGWIDDHVTIHVVPSLLSLGNEIGAPPASGTPLVAVSEATDLRFLDADRAIATGLIPGARLLEGDISPDTVLRALVDTPTAVLSGHASHSLVEGGGLAFGQDLPETGGEPVSRWLTAEAIERLPLRDRNLIVLSSCSSAQIAIDLPDESIGLPAAFLGAGFTSAIATVWPVRDPVAFVTLARLLQQRAARPQQPPSEALRQTRRWLRTATRDDLQIWLDALEFDVQLPAELVELLRRWWADCPDLHPLAYPRDWAAFSCTGL